MLAQGKAMPGRAQRRPGFVIKEPTEAVKERRKEAFNAPFDWCRPFRASKAIFLGPRVALRFALG